MNIRIIAGKYGGRSIEAPPGKRTHPMSERVRNALFNSLGDEVAEATVLDAFAGTGSVGIEALSRGAAHVTFIEKDRVAGKVLQSNLDLLRIDNAKLVRSSVSAWCDTTEPEPRFDLIFADPPYHDVQFSTVRRLLAYLKPDGCMILSHPGRGEELLGNNEFVVVDDRSYGNAHLTFFRRVEQPQK